MRYGKYVSPEILQELAYYSKKLDIVEKKLYGADTYKGKEHIWVELLPGNGCVIYGSELKKWYAEYFDETGIYLGMFEDTQPFDYKAKQKEMKRP